MAKLIAIAVALLALTGCNLQPRQPVTEAECLGMYTKVNTKAHVEAVVQACKDMFTPNPKVVEINYDKFYGECNDL